MTATDSRRPLGLKLFRPVGKLRPALMGKPQIVRGKRKFSKLMKCNLCKVASGCAVQKLVERLPEGQKIQPGAETALRYDKQAARMLREAGAEMISFEEDIARLFQSVIIRKVDVIKISGNRCTSALNSRLAGCMAFCFT